FCTNLNIDFLTVRLYAGLWVLLISIITVAVDGSRMLRYVTRFTEDIFASLISVIFIAESLRFLYQLRRALGDFGVLISIAVVASLAHLFVPDPYLQRLEVPDHFSFTNIEARQHGLFVSAYLPLNQLWIIIMSLVAALLVFILLFVETEITE
ncbi:unnamed protein product, partial [Acanthocheilonema viteae]